MRPNLGGPSDRTLKKHSSGYKTESGIINPFLRTFHDLASKPDSAIIDSRIVKVLGMHAENDGTALKPSLQFDTTQKKVRVHMNVVPRSTGNTNSGTEN